MENRQFHGAQNNKAPVAPPPAQLNQQRGIDCCCFSLRTRQRQVSYFLQAPNYKLIYKIFYVICLVSFLVYFGFVVQGLKPVRSFYQSYQSAGGQILGPKSNECSSCTEKIQNFQSYNHIWKIIFSFVSVVFCMLLAFPYFPENEENYEPNRYVLILFLYFFYNSDNRPRYRVVNLMDKFYSGILLLMIFTLGSTVGYSPVVFIRTEQIVGEDIYCITEMDASKIEKLNDFLYILSMILFGLYGASLIFLTANCIRIRIYKILTGFFLTVCGSLSIVMSFIIIVSYSIRFIKVFYIITFLALLIIYSMLHRQYINDKFKCCQIGDDEQDIESQQQQQRQPS